MSFYTDVILKDPRHKSPALIKDPALLEPGTRAAVAAVIADAKAAGHDLRILETYRSPARQQMLFAAGATKLRQVGCHGFGVAADLGLFVGGHMDPDGGHYGLLRDLCIKHALIWGGDWGEPGRPHSFRDYDHVQRVPLFRQPALFAGTWFPDPHFDPREGPH